MQRNLPAGLGRDFRGVDVALDGVLEDAMHVVVDVAFGALEHLAGGAGDAQRIGPLGIVVGRGGDEHRRGVEELAAQLRQQAAAVLLEEPPADKLLGADIQIHRPDLRRNVGPPVDRVAVGLGGIVFADGSPVGFSAFARCHWARR